MRLIFSLHDIAITQQTEIAALEIQIDLFAYIIQIPFGVVNKRGAFLFVFFRYSNRDGTSFVFCVRRLIIFFLLFALAWVFMEQATWKQIATKDLLCRAVHAMSGSSVTS